MIKQVNLSIPSYFILTIIHLPSYKMSVQKMKLSQDSQPRNEPEPFITTWCFFITWFCLLAQNMKKVNYSAISSCVTAAPPFSSSRPIYLPGYPPQGQLCIVTSSYITLYSRKIFMPYFNLNLLSGVVLKSLPHIPICSYFPDPTPNVKYCNSLFMKAKMMSKSVNKWHKILDFQWE